MTFFNFTPLLSQNTYFEKSKKWEEKTGCFEAVAQGSCLSSLMMSSWHSPNQQLHCLQVASHKLFSSNFWSYSCLYTQSGANCQLSMSWYHILPIHYNHANNRAHQQLFQVSESHTHPKSIAYIHNVSKMVDLY